MSADEYEYLKNEQLQQEGWSFNPFNLGKLFGMDRDGYAAEKQQHRDRVIGRYSDVMGTLVKDLLDRNGNFVDCLTEIVSSGKSAEKIVSELSGFIGDNKATLTDTGLIGEAVDNLKTQRTKDSNSPEDVTKLENALIAKLERLKQYEPQTPQKGHKATGSTMDADDPPLIRKFSMNSYLYKDMEEISEIDDYSVIEKQLTKKKELVVRKIGSYWRETDEQTYNMITAMIKKTIDGKELMSLLRGQIQGRYNVIRTSFGDKLRLYLDYTASGQELLIINKFFDHIVENYANTHTEISYNGKFMNRLFHEAEESILKSVNAPGNQFTVIPLGTGATGAIMMVQKILGTYIPPKTKKLIGAIKSFDDIKNELRTRKELPLVIITAYEHHSNEVTWRYQLCDIKVVPLNEQGYMDLGSLRDILEENRDKYTKILGSFSAGSNVTGIKTEIEDVVEIMKEYNGWVFFDYAGTGPYVKIDMSIGIDGIYLSPHKFLGGPGSCGIAIINNRIYDTEIEPTHGGGGTVDFVNENTALFTANISAREMSGTPGILQLIKAGIAINLKDDLSYYLHKREIELSNKFFDRFSKDERLFIFGPHEVEKRVPIVSFNIRHTGPKGQRILHPAFVIKLLSELFGIQGRSGCSCAGPYGHRLFGINEIVSKNFMSWVRNCNKHGCGFGGIKLGWARINLHYTLSDEEMDYIIQAIDFIADYGYMFLPFYFFNPKNANWEHVREEEIGIRLLTFKLLQIPQVYAKDDKARYELFKQQIQEAHELMETLDKDFELDCLDKWEDLAFFYVAKGKLQYKELIDRKAENLQNTC